VSEPKSGRVSSWREKETERDKKGDNTDGGGEESKKKRTGSGLGGNEKVIVSQNPNGRGQSSLAVGRRKTGASANKGFETPE